MIEEASFAESPRIGIVTAGFHIPRTKVMLSRIPWYEDKNTVFIPAYGEHTAPDNWYSDPAGKSICLSEIAKAAVEAIEAMELTDKAKRRLIREILQKSS